MFDGKRGKIKEWKWWLWMQFFDNRTRNNNWDAFMSFKDDFDWCLKINSNKCQIIVFKWITLKFLSDKNVLWIAKWCPLLEASFKEFLCKIILIMSMKNSRELVCDKVMNDCEVEKMNDDSKKE